MTKEKKIKNSACIFASLLIFALIPRNASAEEIQFSSMRNIITTSSVENDSITNIKEQYTGWQVIVNGWSYYKNGVLQTGWQYIDGYWYYFDSNGTMQHDTSIGTFNLDSNGRLVKG